MVSEPTDLQSEHDRLVSVALLTKNGMPSVGLLMARLAVQRCSSPVEMVALDSGSSDGTAEVLAAAGAAVYQTPPDAFSFGPCRQRCFELTHGSVIVTLSQDALPGGDDWLESMVGPILAGCCDVVMGQVRIPQSTRFAWTRWGKFYLVRPRWRFDLYPDLDCVSLAISRSAWAATGFGRVPVNEDKFLALHVGESGLRCQHQAGGFVYHAHEYTVLGLVKRCFNEGLGTRRTRGGYGLLAAMADALAPRVWNEWLRAVARGEIVTPAELGFPLIRPAALLAGYCFGRNLWV